MKIKTRTTLAAIGGIIVTILGEQADLATMLGYFIANFLIIYVIALLLALLPYTIYWLVRKKDKFPLTLFYGSSLMISTGFVWFAHNVNKLME